MTDWLVLAGYLVIGLMAMSLDGIARANAEDARLEAFVAEDRHSAFVEPAAVERLGPLVLGWLSLGGATWAKRGAVARLVADGVLHRTSPDGPSPQRWVTRGPLPEGANEFARELWAAAAPQPVSSSALRPADWEGHHVWALPDAYRLMDEVEARLISEGLGRHRGELVPGGGQRHRGWWSTAATAVVVTVVTVLVLDQAWIRAVLAFLSARRRWRRRRLRATGSFREGCPPEPPKGAGAPHGA
jgi:hypothetical protein